jgi:PAS domain-containing protein
MIAMGSTFYATYRDIRDALLSSKQRISKEFLFDFLSCRGVLISGSSTREELIETLASLTHGYSDFEEIYNQLEVVPRPERTTSRAIETSVDSTKLQAAVEAIRAARRDHHEAINLIVAEGGAAKIKVEYTELDHGKTLLRQRRAKDAEVEIYKVGEQIRLRYPANERLENIVDTLIESMQKNEKEPIKQEVVDLSSFDKEHRTLFFKSLITNLTGYEFSDVIKVAVDNEIDAVEFSDEADFTEEDTDDEQTETDDAADVAELRAEVEAGVKSFLKSAALDGTGVLHSKELQQFLESGFFISRVVWQSIQNAKNGYKVEIEAMLENPSKGTGFRYSVKGYYPCKKNGSHALTRRQATDAVKKPVLSVVENAAMEAFRELSVTQAPNDGGCPS